MAMQLLVTRADMVLSGIEISVEDSRASCRGGGDIYFRLFENYLHTATHPSPTSSYGPTIFDRDIMDIFSSDNKDISRMPENGTYYNYIIFKVIILFTSAIYCMILDLLHTDK